MGHLVQFKAALQIEVIGFEAAGMPLDEVWRGIRRPRAGTGLAGQAHLELVDDGLRDLVLDFKDVGHFAVIAFSPEIVPLSHVNKLHADADAVTRLAHAAFENARYAEGFTNLSHVLLHAFKYKCGCPCSYAQIFQVRQRVDDFFGQAIAEVFVLLVRAHVEKRQHGDGRRIVDAHRGQGFECRLDLSHRLESCRRCLAQAAHDHIDQARRRAPQRRP